MIKNDKVIERYSISRLANEQICCQCGKPFYISCSLQEYAYKRDLKYIFCKWSCMREWDRIHVRKETRGRHREAER